MRIRYVIFSAILLMAAFFAWFSTGVQAAPAGQQQYPSPTPGPDGRIIYIVKAGDNCLLLQLLYGVSVDYIRTTNHLDENCTLQEGQRLMLGIGGPSASTSTPGPSPTPSPIPPTVTPRQGGSAQVCVLLYDDANGDGLRQTSETAIAGGAISLTSLTGSYSQTLTTVHPSDANAFPGMCFNDVPEGNYTVSAAVPDGYNPTTDLTFALDSVTAGNILYVDIGAQQKSSTGDSGGSGGHTVILGVLGVLFLLGGIGLGVYAWRIMRK